MCCHQPAVAQHGHPVGNPGDLLQPMADVDEAHALLSQLINLSEEPFCLLAAESGGRLIQNQELGIERQRLRNFDLLLRGDSQGANKCRRRNIQTKTMKLLRRATIHRLPIDDYPASRKPPDEYILRDRQVRQQSHLLVNQDDTGIDRFTRSSRSIGSPFPLHRACIGLNQTSDDR